MKILNIFKRVLLEGKIQNPIIDTSVNGNKISFELSPHAEERMTRVENDSEITLDELKRAINEAIPKISVKAFVAGKKAIQGPVTNGKLYLKDFKSGKVTRKEAQEFFIYKSESGLQIKCKVLNFNRNQGFLEIIIKTLMKSHTQKLKVYDHHRNTLHLNIIESVDDEGDYFVIII